MSSAFKCDVCNKYVNGLYCTVEWERRPDVHCCSSECLIRFSDEDAKAREAELLRRASVRRAIAEGLRNVEWSGA